MRQAYSSSKVPSSPASHLPPRFRRFELLPSSARQSHTGHPPACRPQDTRAPRCTPQSRAAATTTGACTSIGGVASSAESTTSTLAAGTKGATNSESRCRSTTSSGHDRPACDHGCGSRSSSAFDSHFAWPFTSVSAKFEKKRLRDGDGDDDDPPIHPSIHPDTTRPVRSLTKLHVARNADCTS